MRRLGPLPCDGDELFGEPLSEINVTPMVDVMLVLLIVFMVAAPLMTAGVPVELPKTAAVKVAQSKAPLIVSVDAAGDAFIEKEPVPGKGLVERLSPLAGEDRMRVVLVRGDKAVPYGRIMEVMGQIGAAGFTRVSLIAEAPPSGAAP